MKYILTGILYFALTTINLKFAEPGEKSCYRSGNISFFDKICLSNAAKYPYFPSKKLRRS